MRRQLYTLFSTYGPLLSIIATRSESMRGQAFVVFRDLAHATAARRALDGFEFYERGMRIEYARSKSKATLLEERGAEGVWEVQAQLAKGKEGSNGKVTFSSAGAERVGRERKRAREEARERGEKAGESSEEEESSDEEEKPAKAAKVVAENGDGKEAPAATPAADGAEEDDEDEMDMADSDDDSDAGPKPPPAS